MVVVFLLLLFIFLGGGGEWGKGTCHLNKSRPQSLTVDAWRGTVLTVWACLQGSKRNNNSILIAGARLASLMNEVTPGLQAQRCIKRNK